MAELSPETRDAVRAGAIQSAAAVLPIIFQTTGLPACLLDVGAGEGHWVDEAVRLGVPAADAWGVDLEAEAEEYRWDAEAGTPLPLHPTYGKWSVVLCLETAEHVTPRAGGHLVAELCSVTETIVWSAAVPGQGGDGHVNEAWPRDWHEVFQTHGFVLVDPWRDRLWECADVEPWYRQNLLLAQRVGTTVSAYPAPRSLVDPVTFAHHRGTRAPGQ